MHLSYQVRHVCLHDFFFFSSSLFLVRRLTRLACSWLAIDTLDAGRCKLDVGCWTLEVGRCTLDVGRWTFVVGRWTVDVARWMLDVGHVVTRCDVTRSDVGRLNLDVGRWTLEVVGR